MDIDTVSRFFGKNKNEDTSDQILNLNLDLLKPNPFQPRKHFEPALMDELSRSIAEIGVIQPIVVRQSGDKYEIVAGERRWRAAGTAGLSAIPSIVRDFSDREMAEIALIENLQRADLNYFEEAEGYRRLIEDFKVTQEDLAIRVGKSQPTVANKLRLLKIDPIVKENVVIGLLTERHVRALLKLRTPDEQMAILKEIYEKELNVKDTEYLISEFLEGRVVINEEPDDEKNGESREEKKRAVIRSVFSDMRMYVNTIKQAVNTISDAGIEARLDQEENDENIILTITLKRMKK